MARSDLVELGLEHLFPLHFISADVKVDIQDSAIISISCFVVEQVYNSICCVLKL